MPVGLVKRLIQISQDKEKLELYKFTTRSLPRKNLKLCKEMFNKMYSWLFQGIGNEVLIVVKKRENLQEKLRANPSELSRSKINKIIVVWCSLIKQNYRLHNI